MTAPSPRTLSPTRNLSTPVLGMPPPPTAVTGIGASSPLQPQSARRVPLTPSMSSSRLLHGGLAPQGFSTPGNSVAQPPLQGVVTPGGFSTPGGTTTPARATPAGEPPSPPQQAHSVCRILKQQQPPSLQPPQQQQQQQQQQQGHAPALASTPTPRKALAAVSPGMVSPSSPGFLPPPAPANSPTPVSDTTLQAEIARRHAAESRVRELEALVAKLRGRLAALEGRREGSPSPGGSATAESGRRQHRCETPPPGACGEPAGDDPIDLAICEYLERNPDFPVSIQKVAHNYYVFGDRGTVYVTKRGEHIVVRVGGGFKSLQVFMDERALMVTREHAAALTEKGQSAAVAA